MPHCEGGKHKPKTKSPWPVWVADRPGCRVLLHGCHPGRDILMGYLENPKNYLSETKMTSAGLRRGEKGHT